jgi:hypothetical protein
MRYNKEEKPVVPKIIKSTTKRRKRRIPKKNLKQKLIKTKKKKKAPAFTKSKRTVYVSKIAGVVHLDSTWETEYAKYLDANNIKWKRNLIMFPYMYRRKMFYYIPDFYLIDEDVYIEIKGYQRAKDAAKWRDFPYKLIVLKKKELLELGLNIK